MFHPLLITTPLPQRVNNPFYYKPHPLCCEAAKQVMAHVDASPLREEFREGKMLGVLVCQTVDGQVGFFAAYSGQVGGRQDWPWFVPAVFDYLQPDGHFRQEEARISAINAQIVELINAKSYTTFQTQLCDVRQQAQEEIDAYRTLMEHSKQQRNVRRQAGVKTEDLIRESQFQKAELRRMKQRWQQAIVAVEQRLKPLQTYIDQLKQERSQRSYALQQWLFEQFVMLNARGERRTLTEIFLHTPQHTPPSGSGECCAPKLLQQAYLSGLHPLCIAEFWYGSSPRMEVRHHGAFYTACRGKCKPILEWMLQGLDMEDVITETPKQLEIVYEDAHLLVVNKPNGLLSVPGRIDAPSVMSLLQAQGYTSPMMVHRLDMDTSGLMIVALSMEAYHHLQRQFLKRTVEKHYVALLDGKVSSSGTINLPLRPDPFDRPRQVVDPVHGKPAVTDYKVISYTDNRTRIVLTPHTGRTHQLRVHCAHHDGLSAPIIGDNLYGHAESGQRLCLHAKQLSFTHPISGERLNFQVPAPF
jgi:tRNA pseudouridine32 synthase/23S rRNA pseudouridine746 synthase